MNVACNISCIRFKTWYLEVGRYIIKVNNYLDFSGCGPCFNAPLQGTLVRKLKVESANKGINIESSLQRGELWTFTSLILRDLIRGR